jgi:2-polyprenyl-3-methyl-5-hydroxy-6-metoxy-1,4-benzoquinol methylase
MELNKKAMDADYYNTYGRRALLAGYAEFLPFYDDIKLFLPKMEEDDKLIDLGCGVGFFERYLYSHGITNVEGWDFSEESLRHARLQAPGNTFKQVDLTTPKLKKLLKKYEYFVCMEVLEHIDDDLYIFQCLPAGAKFTGTVPAFDYESHVRRFPDVNDIVDRYGEYITFYNIKSNIDPNLRLQRFIFNGVIKDK